MSSREVVVVAPLSVTLIVSSLVIAVWVALTAVLNRRPGVPHLAGLALVELAWLAQIVVAAVRFIGGDRPEATAVFVLYLVGGIFILPVGTLWSLEERSRSSTLVLAAACLVIPIMVVRMRQVWQGTG